MTSLEFTDIIIDKNQPSQETIKEYLNEVNKAKKYYEEEEQKYSKLIIKDTTNNKIKFIQ